jgi:hypothetical protein
MRSAHEGRTTISRSPPSTPRILTRPPGPPGSARTLLDGGWWPRTADAVAELPGLISALDHRHGPITRVMLRRADWDSHPRRLRIDDPGYGSSDLAAGRVLRLGWFDSMPAGLLTATCANGRRIDLLTVPSHTSEPAAWAAMEHAADPGNRMHTPELVSAATTLARPVAGIDDQAADIGMSEYTWESEGGRLGSPTRPRALRTGVTSPSGGIRPRC